MRAVELFCGAGGMGLGLKKAGFDLVQAYDAWQPAVEAYRKNVGPHAWVMDLKDIYKVGPMVAALAPDIIVGGPPCQDYSSAGKNIEGENAGMTRAYAMLVCIARPRWFVMENVSRASRSQAWAEARAMLVKAGYGLSECKLDAAFHGVPQSRKRLFVVGRLGETDGFLDSALMAARSERAMTVRDMFGLGIKDAFYVHPRFPGKKGVWSATEPAPTVRGSYRRPMPESYQPHPDDASLIQCGEFCPADPVPTGAATLTQEQVARIQGFPVGWEWSTAGSGDIDQMIANAVPSPLAEAIGRVILARENGETIPEIQGRFLQWLRLRGRSGQSSRNVKSQLHRARRLLGGRTFADMAAEVAALEAAEGFIDLPTRLKSDLRAALRLHAEWRQETVTKKPKASKVEMKDAA